MKITLSSKLLNNPEIAEALYKALHGNKDVHGDRLIGFDPERKEAPFLNNYLNWNESMTFDTEDVKLDWVNFCDLSEDMRIFNHGTEEYALDMDLSCRKMYDFFELDHEWLDENELSKQVEGVTVEND